MKNKLALAILTLVLHSCTHTSSKMNYPKTKKENNTLEFFGHKVEDPYLWLENDTSQATGEWVKEQNKITTSYLEQIPFRDEIKARITELIDIEKTGMPVKIGNRFLIYKNEGLEPQGKYFVREGLDGKDELFLDVNSMSAAGTTSATMLSASKDKRFVPFAISEGGSDWSKIVVYDMATKQPTGDVIEWVKFSNTAWNDEGFFYSRYPAPEEGQKLSGNNLYHMIYFHKMGTPQSEDILVYRDEERPYMYHGLYFSEDRKFQFLVCSPGTDGSEIWYREGQSILEPFKPLLTDVTEHNNIIDATEDGKFLLHTDVGAPTYRLVEMDPAKPEKEHWKEIIPAQEMLLEGVRTSGGKLVASYLDKGNTRIKIFDADGSNGKNIELPDRTGSAGGFSAKKEDTYCFYSFSSFTYPGVIYKYDFTTGVSAEFSRLKLKFSPEDFESKQVMYTSKDGTQVPIFIVHKKGIALNGNNPTLLYGYGGFNVPVQPGFSASRIMFLERGGIYCIANIRGGSELGEEWHQGGMKEKKQNVFDDFIAAAEYLISQGYTSSHKLAIQGGSNGGLLVGACMTQRPDLFKVAFPAVGVLDMLRYHKFTVGKGWIPEYGCADNSEQEFNYLYAYSPYHNLKPGVAYPATLITTADHDDRVVPAHSFKFAARLQEYHDGPNPVLIRIETSAGHGAGKSTQQAIEEVADIYAFLFYNMLDK